MARVSFSLTSTITAAPAQVKQLMAAFEDVGKYHPLIIGVNEMEPDTAPSGTPRRRYKVTDRMRLGPLPMRFTYVATSTSPAEDRLYCEAFQSPGVHLMITYDFFQEGEQTRIEEQCDIDAPWALRNFVRNQAKAAHLQTMAQIKRYLEQPTQVSG